MFFPLCKMGRPNYSQNLSYFMSESKDIVPGARFVANRDQYPVLANESDRYVPLPHDKFVRSWLVGTMEIY